MIFFSSRSHPGTLSIMHYLPLLEGDRIVGTSIHPDWTQVVQPPKNSKDVP